MWIHLWKIYLKKTHSKLEKKIKRYKVKNFQVWLQGHMIVHSWSDPLRTDQSFWWFLDAQRYFFIFFTWRETDVESNSIGFIFFGAFMNYLWISKELCRRHLRLIVGLAKLTHAQFDQRYGFNKNKHCGMQNVIH